MKSGIKILLFVIAIPVVGLVFRYGTLAPCEMLKTDLRGQAVTGLFENSSSSGNPWEMMGQGLGLLMLGPMIDNFVSTLSPWECSKALYRLNVQGEELLPKQSTEKTGLQNEPVIAESLEKERTGREEEKKEQEEKLSYIPLIDLYEFKAKYYTTYSDDRVPGVEFKLKNNGDRTLKKVEVTVYFKDSVGTVIAEQDYHPVLVTEYSFRDNKPLKPGYIWQQERGNFYQAKSVPSEWSEGQAEARVTDIEFLDDEITDG